MAKHGARNEGRYDTIYTKNGNTCGWNNERRQIFISNIKRKGLFFRSSFTVSNLFTCHRNSERLHFVSSLAKTKRRQRQRWSRCTNTQNVYVCLHIFSHRANAWQHNTLRISSYTKRINTMKLPNFEQIRINAFRYIYVCVCVYMPRDGSKDVCNACAARWYCLSRGVTLTLWKIFLHGSKYCKLLEENIATEATTTVSNIQNNRHYKRKERTFSLFLRICLIKVVQHMRYWLLFRSHVSNPSRARTLEIETKLVVNKIKTHTHTYFFLSYCKHYVHAFLRFHSIIMCHATHNIALSFIKKTSNIRFRFCIFLFLLCSHKLKINFSRLTISLTVPYLPSFPQGKIIQSGVGLFFF